MVATDGQPTLDDLSAWLATLNARAEALRGEILGKQTELTQVEERLKLVSRLLEVETRAHTTPLTLSDDSTAFAAPDIATGSASDLEDAVERILRAVGEPLHISNIREMLLKEGVPIPGRGDEANIIVRLTRFASRFTRTARGTYGLAEWGVPELARKPRKRRRSGAK